MKAMKKLFSPPSAMELAAHELAEAERQLLAAQTAEEYARNLAVYNAQRITRLKAFLATGGQ